MSKAEEHSRMKDLDETFEDKYNFFYKLFVVYSGALILLKNSFKFYATFITDIQN